MSRYVRGYLIRQEICFSDNCGYILGESPKEAFEVAVFQFVEINGAREYTNGRYFIGSDADLAALDFGDRVSAHKAGNPGVTEKYNYLAAAEMSDEDNYNQIDGVPNNTTKPSILEKLKEYQDRIKPPETEEKSGRQPEYRR